MQSRTPVLMLGLDAAELTLVQRWVDEGRLPVLERLRRNGCSGALHSPAGLYAGGVWPSFYTGQDVPWHGIFHNKQWRPAAMRCEVPTRDWIGSRPFWERLDTQGLRLCIVDVPMILGQPPPLNGIYLGGWGTHDLIARGSSPPSLWRHLRARYGAPAMPREHFGPQSVRSLTRLADRLLRSTGQMQSIACELLRQEPWDFACIVLGATHRAGHYLWDLSQVDAQSLPTEQRDPLEAALARIYAATDRAIGAMLEQVDPGTLVVAFAVHGMGPNPGWSDLVPDVLEAAQQRTSGHKPKKGLAYTLKRQLPFQWVRPLVHALPGPLIERLVSVWSARMYDWTQTRHFPVPMDQAAYIRINLRGRERLGTVDPGRAYNDACSEIEHIFAGLRDCATGRPIAGEPVRAYAQAPDSAPCRHLMPDIIVPWDGPRADQVNELSYDSLPGLRFRVPSRSPAGRSGNHTGRGWFIAAGPGVQAGRQIDGCDVIDLAPTVLKALGLDPPPDLHGRPIPLSAQRS